MTEHKLLDLFSGIGGFSFAADKFGIKTIAFVEKEPFCQKVLKKHWNDVPIIDDIRKVKGEDYGSATIVSGGFPCQPFSVAGKRKGTDDDRYLWDETIRVVAECKPRWFIGENVDGLVNIQNGMVLRQVQDDLEKEGFQVQCLVIPASGVGAWHQRKRVWIIGHNVSHTECLGFSERSSIRGLHKKESNDSNKFSDKSKTGTKKGNVSDTNVYGSQARHIQHQLSSKEINERETNWSTRNNASSRKHNVSNTNHSRFQNRTEQCEGQSTSDEQRESSISRQSSVSDSESKYRNEFSNDSKFGKIPQEEIFRNRSCIQKSERPRSWWQTESSVRGVPDGISYELDKGRVNRLKALGNSIVPQIAEQLFKSIIYAEQ